MLCPKLETRLISYTICYSSIFRRSHHNVKNNVPKIYGKLLQASLLINIQFTPVAPFPGGPVEPQLAGTH